MEAVIETRGLTKRFGSTVALDQVAMSVPKGSVYGLVGPNGAGKSTLVASLAGALRPTSGEALVFGRPATKSPEARSHVAWIPSEPYFLFGEDLEGMASFIANLYPSFSSSRCTELARKLGLEKGRPLRKLSKGMQRRAAFVLALSTQPELLLLDEPMDGLDPLARRTVWKLVLEEVSRRGLTVLISSHNLRELEGVCDRLGIMAGGRMKYEGQLNDPNAELVKVQVVFPEGETLPSALTVLSDQEQGRMHTLVAKGDAESIRRTLAATHPQYLQAQPLSLEELFLFEMGGSQDELHDIAP